MNRNPNMSDKTIEREHFQLLFYNVLFLSFEQSEGKEHLTNRHLLNANINKYMSM